MFIKKLSFLVLCFAMLAGCSSKRPPLFAQDNLPPDPWVYPNKEGTNDPLPSHKKTS